MFGYYHWKSLISLINENILFNTMLYYMKKQLIEWLSLTKKYKKIYFIYSRKPRCYFSYLEFLFYGLRITDIFAHPRETESEFYSLT